MSKFSMKSQASSHMSACGSLIVLTCLFVFVSFWDTSLFQTRRQVTSSTQQIPLGKLTQIIDANVSDSDSDPKNDSVLPKRNFFDSDSTLPLLTARLIYFPRIPKTGSTTVNQLYRDWLTKYCRWKLRKFATDFLSKSAKSLDISTANNVTRTLRLNRIEQMISAIDGRIRGKLPKDTFVKSSKAFNTGFGDSKMSFAEMGDGCAQTGGNQMLKTRTTQLKKDFKNVWNGYMKWLNTTQRQFTEGLYQSLTIADSSEFVANVTMARQLTAIRSVLGSDNCTLEIAFMFYAHFPFLKSVEEWMRQFLAPFPMSQMVFLRQPIARITSLFYFIRQRGYHPKRSEMVRKITNNKNLLQCTEDLDNALKKVLPNARIDPYDTCHMPVNLQLKWMCGDLEHCPCSDVMNETHVELAMETTLKQFDYVGFIETMAADFVGMRRTFFDDVPESEWKKVLATPKRPSNKQNRKKTADDLKAADILTKINHAEVNFYGRLLAVGSTLQ